MKVSKIDFFLAKFIVFENDSNEEGVNLPYITIVSQNSKKTYCELSSP